MLNKHIPECTHMVSKGYILSLQSFRNWDIVLSRTTTEILRRFVEMPELSVYRISKILEFPISYKNVHKKVKRLQLLGIIEKSKKKSNHGAIYYKLTKSGVFYTFLKRLWYWRYLSVSLRGHRNDEFFQEFLYPYFEHDSLARIRSFYITSTIISYLQECCASLVTSLKNISAISKFEKFTYTIFEWYKILESRTQKRLLRYLRNRFDIDWINIDRTKLNITDKNKRIEIKEKGNIVYIILDLESKKAVLVENGKVLFQYKVSLSKSDPRLIKIVDPQYSVPESTLAEQIEYIDITMKENLGKLIFSIVTNYEWIIERGGRPHDTEEVKRNDIEILRQDKKFLKELKGIGSRFESFQKEFINAA